MVGQREGILSLARPQTLWSPLHTDAPDHRKIYELADELKIPQAYAFGLCCSLWARALSRLPQGSTRSPRMLADLAGWSGDPEAFCCALGAAGLLTHDGGVWRIHEWEAYGGASIRRKEDLIQRFKGARGARSAAVAAAVATPIAAPSAAADASKSRSRSSSDLEGGVGETKTTGRPMWATRTEPLSMHGPIPDTIGKVWAFQWRDGDIAAHLKRAAPDLDETSRWDQTEDCLNYRCMLSDREFRQWLWPQGCIPRLIAWLERANTTHLNNQAARARAAKSGAYVADTKRIS